MHLIDAKETTLLGHVEMKDNKQGGMQQHLGVGEDPTTPRRQALARESQFVEMDLARLHVGGRFIPSIGDDIFKTRHQSQKFSNLKVRGFRGPDHQQARGGNGPTRRRRGHLERESQSKGPNRSCNKRHQAI
jgi:hypothetical protein